MRLLAAPDGADDGIEHVVHDHAPAGDVAQGGVDFLADVGESRPSAGIGARHAAIADGGKQHRYHGDQNRGDHVPTSAVAEHAEHGHGRDRLDHDYAVQDQVPEGERPSQARSSEGELE